jgi:hypothetical protein
MTMLDPNGCAGSRGGHARPPPRRRNAMMATSVRVRGDVRPSVIPVIPTLIRRSVLGGD